MKGRGIWRKPSAAEVPDPPQPPEAPRRTRFYATQLVGVPLLALLPILALLGVFGTTESEQTASGAGLELTVTYPTRLRYKTLHPLTVTVRNSAGLAQNVAVEIDKAYLEQFSNVSATPMVSAVTDEVYRIDLGELAPGEIRGADLELQAETYWRHAGGVSARVSDDEAASVNVVTSVYP